MQFVITIGGTILAWAIVLGALFLLRHAPRTVFITAHYLINIGVFAFLTYLLRKEHVQFSAGGFAVIVVGILLILELFYWVYVNPASAARYLTVIDWLIPAFLVLGTVYLVALFVRVQ